MVNDVDIALSNDHPFALELSSLREAVSHFQGETHRVTVQLRHQSLEQATLLQQLHALEGENSYLRAELQVHRTAGPADAHRDALQIQELTLALRRLSDKLVLTEKVLLERNEELSTAHHARDFVRRAESNATEAVKRLRSELATSHARERDLEHRVKSAEEQRIMTDIVVEEYANLVRSLEGRPSSISRTNGSGVSEPSRSSLDGLAHARQGLHKLLQESNRDSEKLHSEIDHLHDALELTRSDLEAERGLMQESKQRLAEAQLELHRLRCDDNAAAKMVSRYMKFSQSSTELLHGTIEKLKTRQEAITTSYEGRLHQLEDRLTSEKRQAEMLHRALDELTEDISREAYGRRREIVLRLQSLAREEMFSEKLRRWLLRSREVLQKLPSSESDGDPGAVFTRILDDAQDILSFINGTDVLEWESQSSAARVYAAFATVKILQTELSRETDRRLYFEHQLADSQFHTVPSNNLHVKALTAVPRMPTTRPSETVTSVSSDEHPNKRGTSITPVIPGDLNEAHDEDSTDLIPSVSTKLVMEAEINPDPSPLTPLHDTSPSSIASNVAAPEEGKPGSESTESGCHDDKIGSSLLEDPPSDTSGVLISGRADPPVPTTQPTLCLSNEDEGMLSTLDGTEEIYDRRAVTARFRLANAEELEGSLEKSPHAASEMHSVSPFCAMLQDERFRRPASLDGLQGSVDTSLKDRDFADLLSRIAKVNERYADIQRSFRDCHVTLQELRQMAGDVPDSKIWNVAIGRLNDYCEDARVELEIRISDEERIASGFQTLLSVPGALSDEVNEQDVMQQIEKFIDGTDNAVQRAQETLKRKLDDLEHDIASIKRAMHGSPSPMPPVQDLPEQRSNLPSTSSWASWTGSILGPSRTSSPAPSFGAVMTSPRLRHSSSTRSLRGESSNIQSPLANLDLRIPMPIIVQHEGERPSQSSMQRTQSHVATHVVGLGLRGSFNHGVRKSSLGFNNNGSSFSRPAIPKADRDVSDLDGDVE